MQRKELHAILDDEFIIFLKENNLYDDFHNGKIKCAFCRDIITIENIYAIFYTDNYKFCCIKLDCTNIFKTKNNE